jgi:hypothetical protein
VILDLGLGHEGARLRAVAVVLRHVSEMVPVAGTQLVVRHCSPFFAKPLVFPFDSPLPFRLCSLTFVLDRAIVWE